MLLLSTHCLTSCRCVAQALLRSCFFAMSLLVCETYEVMTLAPDLVKG